ncbi:hypothetical protein [Sinisalibacter aestuarii]|uniref:hypothetical protein n=1 Tax=Sinisalibacter aestuarii TaxID=2949426 RepID=UPI002492E70F|nr:hypothetical protein [Sinisalibacter aestuarii]
MEWTDIAYLAFAAGVLGAGAAWVGFESHDETDEDETGDDFTPVTSTGFGPDYDPDAFIDMVFGTGASAQAAEPAQDDGATAAGADDEPLDHDGAGNWWSGPTSAQLIGADDDWGDDWGDDDWSGEHDLAAGDDGDDDWDMGTDHFHFAAAMAAEGEVTEIFELATDAAPAAIADFDAGSDLLEIEYYPEADPTSGAPIVPDVDVSYDSEADVTSVTLNGTEVVQLQGDAGIAPEDIKLTAIA